MVTNDFRKRAASETTGCVPSEQTLLRGMRAGDLRRRRLVFWDEHRAALCDVVHDRARLEQLQPMHHFGADLVIALESG